MDIANTDRRASIEWDAPHLVVQIQVVGARGRLNPTCFWQRLISMAPLSKVMGVLQPTHFSDERYVIKVG